MEQAVEDFRRAIGRDAGYALAYSGLADAYLLLGSYNHMARKEAHIKAKAAADKALELDETLAEAHASRGQILRSERDWQGEEQEYLRAIALNPSYPTAHQWYATLLAALERSDEALREIRRAEELDPLSHAIAVTVAQILFLARDYDGAIEQLKKTLELEPDFASAHAWLGIVYAEQGAYEEVIRSVHRATELNPDNPNVRVGLAYMYARTGERAKALETMERAVEQGGASWIGVVYGALGETERAFEFLESAVQSEESWSLLLYLKVFPWYAPLRSDPRFQVLLRRMRFPE